MRLVFPEIWSFGQNFRWPLTLTDLELSKSIGSLLSNICIATVTIWCKSVNYFLSYGRKLKVITDKQTDIFYRATYLPKISASNNANTRKTASPNPSQWITQVRALFIIESSPQHHSRFGGASPQHPTIFSDSCSCLLHNNFSFWELHIFFMSADLGMWRKSRW